MDILEHNVLEYKALQIDEEMYVALYDDAFPMIALIVSRGGGTPSDAEDVFHDALIALLETRGTMVIRDHCRYVVGIAKHLWARKSKTNVNLLRLNDFEKKLSIPDVLHVEPSMARLLRLLQRAGARCLDLLHDFYFSQLTISELARRHHLGSPRSASVQKYKCIEKVRNAVAVNNYSYDDFLE